MAASKVAGNKTFSEGLRAGRDHQYVVELLQLDSLVGAAAVARDHDARSDRPLITAGGEPLLSIEDTYCENVIRLRRSGVEALQRACKAFLAKHK